MSPSIELLTYDDCLIWLRVKVKQRIVSELPESPGSDHKSRSKAHSLIINHSSASLHQWSSGCKHAWITTVSGFAHFMPSNLADWHYFHKSKSLSCPRSWCTRLECYLALGPRHLWRNDLLTMRETQLGYCVPCCTVIPSPTKMMRKIIIRKMHICKLAITCCEVWCQNTNRQQHKKIPEPLQIFQPIFLGWTHSILKNNANRNRVHVENGTCATHAFRGVPFLHRKS